MPNSKLKKPSGSGPSSFARKVSLKGEVALITGGGTGLGKGIARSMIDAGARVVIAGRRREKLASACEELGKAAVYCVHDITDFERAPRLVERATAAAGSAPTILVNNAGIHLKKPALEIEETEFTQMLNTHVVGAMALTRAAAKGMVERAQGSVIFISSMAAILGIPQVAAYSAAKSGIPGLVRSLAVELSPLGVRVNAIAPGWIESDMLRKAMNGDPERKTRVLSRTPMHCFGEPEDIGLMSVFLSSRAGKFITGQHIAVDGGVSIGF